MKFSRIYLNYVTEARQKVTPISVEEYVHKINSEKIDNSVGWVLPDGKILATTNINSHLELTNAWLNSKQDLGDLPTNEAYDLMFKIGSARFNIDVNKATYKRNITIQIKNSDGIINQDVIIALRKLVDANSTAYLDINQKIFDDKDAVLERLT